MEQTIEVSAAGISSIGMLLGGISLLVGDNAGVISQLFPVRDENNDYTLVLVRRFPGLDSPIVRILPEERRKGFLVLTADGEAAIFHSTAGRLIERVSLAALQPAALALAPRADGLLIEGADSRRSRLEIENEHPEISFSSGCGGRCGTRFYGQMKNYCDSGLYAELQVQVKEGTVLLCRTKRISLEGSRTKIVDGFRSMSLAQVKWSKPICVDGSTRFATGLKHLIE